MPPERLTPSEVIAGALLKSLKSRLTIVPGLGVDTPNTILVTLARPADVKMMLWLAEVSISRSVNVAVPLASVLTDRVVASTPGPVAMAAVILTPEAATLLLEASCNWMTG